MFKQLLTRIVNFFTRLLPSKSQSQQPQVILTIDPMEPFEKAAIERRNAAWYDIELSDVTQGTIKYKI